MELATILLWIKNNWFVPVGAAILVAVFVTGYHLGGVLQLVEDQKVINKMVGDAQLARNNLQASADKKAREYETARTTSQKKLTAAQKELANVKASNAAYASCHAGLDFVHIYNGIAAASSGSPAAR